MDDFDQPTPDRTRGALLLRFALSLTAAAPVYAVLDAAGVPFPAQFVAVLGTCVLALLLLDLLWAGSGEDIR